MMSRPDESLVAAGGEAAAAARQAAAVRDPVVVKCPSCRETTKAESLNSLRKNYQLMDMLKLHKTVTEFLLTKANERPVVSVL